MTPNGNINHLLGDNKLLFFFPYWWFICIISMILLTELCPDLGKMEHVEVTDQMLRYPDEDEHIRYIFFNKCFLQ